MTNNHVDEVEQYVEYLLSLSIPDLDDLAEQHNNCAVLWSWARNWEEYNREIDAVNAIRIVRQAKIITGQQLGE